MSFPISENIKVIPTLSLNFRTLILIPIGCMFLICSDRISAWLSISIKYFVLKVGIKTAFDIPNWFIFIE